MLVRGVSPSKQQQIILSASSGASWIYCLTLTGSFTSGTAPLSDCLDAASNMRRSLSLLNTFRSEWSPITGATTSRPSSVAFSANHS